MPTAPIPRLGVAYGVGVAVLYAVYILMLRQATSSPGARTAVAASLFEATVGATVASAVLGFVLHDFRLGPAWPTLGWLALLALTSQVIGWLLITVSMPQLPAGMIGALLLVQPGRVGRAQLPDPGRAALGAPVARRGAGADGRARRRRRPGPPKTPGA